MGRRTRGLDAQTAIDIADSMDLPDGAHFAMIGDLMGGDYMTGVEAVMEADGVPMMHTTEISLPENQILALAPYGKLRRCDKYHYQIRDGKTVVADFWPISKTPKWRVGKDGPATEGGPMVLAKALAGDRASAEILQRASAQEILTALVQCVEHMEHGTPQGKKAWSDAKRLIDRTGVWK